MRELTAHKINPCNDVIDVLVVDEPGVGGACHRYDVLGPRRTLPNIGPMPSFGWNLRFQDGPIATAGVNGLTQEVLLAILIDRLEHFQRGPFAHPKNGEALEHCRAALAALHDRTKERVERGVEGTHTV